jgi:hypothetical protein
MYIVCHIVCQTCRQVNAGAVGRFFRPQPRPSPRLVDKSPSYLSTSPSGVPQKAFSRPAPPHGPRLVDKSPPPYLSTSPSGVEKSPSYLSTSPRRSPKSISRLGVAPRPETCRQVPVLLVDKSFSFPKNPFSPQLRPTARNLSTSPRPTCRQILGVPQKTTFLAPPRPTARDLSTSPPPPTCRQVSISAPTFGHFPAPPHGPRLVDKSPVLLVDKFYRRSLKNAFLAPTPPHGSRLVDKSPSYLSTSPSGVPQNAFCRSGSAPRPETCRQVPVLLVDKSFGRSPKRLLSHGPATRPETCRQVPVLLVDKS